MFVRSPRATSPVASTPASFATGALSPVRAASCVSSVADRMIRPSAGTMSPASSETMSPGTISTAGTRATLPSRKTFACGTCRFDRASTLARAFSSCRAPSTTLRTMSSATMTAVEVSPISEAHDGDGDQHEVHRVAQLLQRHRPDRRRLLGRDLVRAPPGASVRRLGAGQACGHVRRQRLHDISGLACEGRRRAQPTDLDGAHARSRALRAASDRCGWCSCIGAPAYCRRCALGLGPRVGGIESGRRSLPLGVLDGAWPPGGRTQQRTEGPPGGRWLEGGRGVARRRVGDADPHRARQRSEHQGWVELQCFAVDAGFDGASRLHGEGRGRPLAPPGEAFETPG